MSEWQLKKIDVEQINNGEKYVEGAITVEDYNQIIEGVFYSDDNSDNAKKISTEALATAKISKEQSASAKAESEKSKAESAEAKANSIQAITTANTSKEQSVQAKLESAEAKQESAEAKANSIQAVATANSSKVESASAKAESAQAKVECANALKVANGIDEKATTALTKSTTAENVSVESRKIAQEALSQVVEGQGSKVTVNGVVQSTWNADLKAEVTSLQNTNQNVTNNATAISSLQTGKADKVSVPTKVSQLTNDSGFDTTTNVDTKLKTKAEKSNAVTAMLKSSGWNIDTQVVTSNGVTATNNIAVGLTSTATLAQIESAGEAMLVAISQSTNSITVKAFGVVPTTDIPIQIIILG